MPESGPHRESDELPDVTTEQLTESNDPTELAEEYTADELQTMVGHAARAEQGIQAEILELERIIAEATETKGVLSADASDLRARIAVLLQAVSIAEADESDR